MSNSSGVQENYPNGLGDGLGSLRIRLPEIPATGQPIQCKLCGPFKPLNADDKQAA